MKKTTTLLFRTKNAACIPTRSLLWGTKSSLLMALCASCALLCSRSYAASFHGAHQKSFSFAVPSGEEEVPLFSTHSATFEDTLASGAVAAGALRQALLNQSLTQLIAVAAAALATVPLLQQTPLAQIHAQWQMLGSAQVFPLTAELDGDAPSTVPAEEATADMKAREHELLQDIQDHSVSWGKTQATIDEIEEEQMTALQEQQEAGEISEEEYQQRKSDLEAQATQAREQLSEVEHSYFDLLSKLHKVMRQIRSQRATTTH